MLHHVVLKLMRRQIHFPPFSINYRAVSNPEQKNGGLLHHPICKIFGTTISMSSMSLVVCMDGST